MFLKKIKFVKAGCQISEMEILMDLHIFIFPESKNLIFKVCLCDFQYVYYLQNSKTISSRNVKFVIYVCIIDKCYSKFLRRSDKHSAYRGTQKNYNNLRQVEKISCLYNLIHLECRKYTAFNIYF